MRVFAAISLGLLSVGLQAGCDRTKPELAESQSVQNRETNPEESGAVGQPTLPAEQIDATEPSETVAAIDSSTTANPELPATIFEDRAGIAAPMSNQQQDTIVASKPGPAAAVRDRTAIMNRPFATLKPLDSDDPEELIEHLDSIDAAIQDLVVAGTNDIVDQQTFVDFGMRLGKLKLETGQKLSNSPSASQQQRKTGVLTTIIALSHLSGLGDVESAKQLESLAEGMLSSEDPDIVHQCRVVLLGFELQSLQNGLSSEAGDLVDQVRGLFSRPEDRNFPEFMMGQQAVYVLSQMGFDEDAQKIQDILAGEYRDSSDPQLRAQTWSYVTRNSQALQNYNLATRSINSPEFNPQDLLAAARGLYQEYPTAQTLEQMSSSIANFEYSGLVELSRQLSEFVKEKMQDLDSSASSVATAKIIADHEARLDLIGKPLSLDGVVDFDGQPINWQDYEGKVVLVDFWATWCVPCLRELPNIRDVYEQYSEDGFTVIGINMDESTEEANNFIGKQNFPWKNYHFQDAAGFQSEFATRHGLKMIPFLVLMDRDGRVSKIHVRGAELSKAVRTYLGLETSLIPEQQNATP